ncbi:hypothetical protein AVEN_136720-1 [Araneus ventricosus]|uniref:RNase H type-1 domain-containing protein n=1 Tax=Araneus ventricosus TaxID=182803 RepID=A0A4Y2EVG4_ARAVE|nr:hypothetical protein AVEN_136720-1 [Araneus ventricosus]
MLQPFSPLDIIQILTDQQPKVGLGPLKDIGDSKALEEAQAFRIFTYFKLASHNSVIQAELLSINFAACWALENRSKINIFTDSLTSTEALKKANSKSLFINQIKSKMFRAIGSVGLFWVKAQAGIPGNELADQYSKIGTTDGQELNVSSLYSYLKRKIKNYILDSRQRHWEDSDKCVRFKGFVPTVDLIN